MTSGPTAPTRGRSWPGHVAFWLSLAGGALAVFAAAGWSFAFDLGPFRVSLRHATNPALAAALFAAFSAWWLGRESFQGLNRRAEALLLGRAGAVAMAMSLLVALVTWTHGAFVAGGADSAGYLTEAKLWLAGSLRVQPPDLGSVRFAQGLEVLAPLGMKPAAGQGHLVPTYPPGFPLLMASLERVAGSGAKFWVVPLSAGLLVWSVFVFGRRLGGAAVGLLAAAATAASPTLLFQAVQPMSDVPAACAWMAAVALLSRSSVIATAAAAGAAITACVIRPNLFAMVPLLALAAWWWETSWRRGLARAAIVALPVVAAALGFAWWQRDLYGALTETGYGGVTYLFSLDHIWPNLQTYPRWLLDSHGWLLLLAVGGPFLAAKVSSGATGPATARARAMAWWAALAFAALFAFYALYFPFDNWTYTRFLLPALPMVFILAAVTAVAVLNRLPARFGTLALAWTLVLVPSLGASRSRELGAFGLWETERRFVEVADYAGSQPPSAVFVSMQHAGSVAYYTGRTILRWDWIEPNEIDAAIDTLAASGRSVYAALEDWEVAEVRKRLAGSAAIAALHTPVFSSRDREAIDAYVFLLRQGLDPNGN
jgi:hypothetical protein